MSFIPKPHEIYKHFKGNLYQITAIAEHTETGEQLVIYQALYDEFKTYARPLSMFTEKVDRDKYPDAGQEFRFELQGPDAERQRAESGGVLQESAGAAFRDVLSESAGAASRDVLQETAGAASGDVLSETTGTGLKKASPEAVITKEWQQNTESEDEQLKKNQENPCSGQQGEEEMAARQKTLEGFSETEQTEELSIDPMVLEFLDADSYIQRLNILAGLHHRITDDMITTMAISCDIEIDDGDIEERYEALKVCLQTLERYECNRLR